MTHEPSNPITVLLVEDDEHAKDVFGLMLEHKGYAVIQAETGDQGLRLARERQPDVILMDVSIPGVDGWTATRRLKGDPVTADIPVIVITAHAFPEDRKMADEVGADAFLTKPCEPRDMLAEVERVTNAGEG